MDLHKEGETRNQNTSPVSNSHVDTKDETMESIQSVNNRVNATGSLNRSASARLWPSEKAEGESKRRSASFRTEHEVVSGTQYSTDPHQTAKTSSSDKKTKPSGPVAPPRPQPRSKSSFVNEKKTPARPTRPVPPPRPKPGKNIKTTNRKNIVNDSSNDRKATDERGQNYGISETREEPKLNKVEISDEQMIQRTDTDSDQSTCNAADDEKKIESGVLKVDNETHETENTTEVETVKSICETDVQKVESDGLKDLDKVVAVQESSVSDSFDNEPRVSVVFTSESEPSQENKSESVRNEDLPLPCVSSIGITDQDKIKSEFDQQKKPDAIVSTEYVIHSNEGVTPPIIVNEPECNVTQKESPVMQVSSSPGKRRKHMSAEDRELSKQGDYETVTLITSSKHSENVETPDDFTETDGNKKRSHSYENTPEFKRKSDEHSYENVPNSFQKDNQMEVQRINGQVASLPCTPTKSDTKLMNNVYDYVPSPSEGDQTEVLDIGKPMSIQPCTLTKSDVEVTNNLYGSIPSSYEGNQTEIQNNYKPVPLPPCTPTKSETKVTNNLYGNIQSSCEGIQTEIQNSNKPLPLPPPAPTKGAAEVTNTSYEYVSPPHKVLEDSTSGFELHPDDENADPDYENTKLSHRYSDSEDEIGDYVDIDKHVKLDNPSKNPDYTNHPNSNSIEQNDTYSTPVKTDNDYFKLPKSCPARLSGGPNRDQDQDGYLLPVEQQSDKPEEFRKSAGDVRRKLFGKEDQVKSHDEPDTSTQKKIRRPAPQPPSFEANTIVRNLRPWQQNQPKFQGNGDLSKRTTAPPEISSSTNSTAEPLDNNALYAAPMKNESSDELSNNTATEPLNNNAIYAAPIKRASLMSDEISASSDSYYKAPSGSITETDTEDNRISLISETLSHHDEYVDPDSLHSGSNRGSLMSDNASAPNNRISTVMDNEYAAPDAELNEHRQSIHSSRSSVSSSGSFSVKLSQTEEYVVMSDHSEESPPKKTAAEDGKFEFIFVV